jgi:hypothetical protein
VDGDGDVDLLIATSSGFFDPYDCDEIHWFENTDGAATFSDPRMISDDILRSRHVFTADVNGDGSPDALSASYEDDKIAWYENLDGLGQFGPQMVVTEFAGGASWVTAGDLDADGDVDLVTASAQAGKIDWYENRSDDCNGNAIPDVCEPDCNSNGIADSCDIRSGFDLDCDLNGVPDLCQTTCGGCDTDSDGCIDDVDSDPTDPYRCGDTDLDQCDDCSSGVFDPWDDGTNSDSDGICDVGDCAPTDNEVWSEPSAIDSLVASRLGPTVGFSWQHPARRGALRVRYDTLRSTLASDFEVPAECIESDSLVAHTSDPEIPAPIAPFFYLVRGETCPSGTGNMGAGSDGVPRTGRSCP